MTKAEKIQELLTRGVEEVIDREHLHKALRSGKKLRVKLGIDPTSPNLHIGRAVVLWKLRAFQELGHQVIFLVGDYTAQIGDTSDKDSERPMLTKEQIKDNMKDYFKQAFKILDKSKTETVYNSQWLKGLLFDEIGRIADAFGLHEFEARENIANRMKAGKRVSLRELFYPLMQGYDSVALKADVELGGTDQRFNLLAGRTIQRLYGQEPQDILTVPLLEGIDGRKMSASWGNVINITDQANDMYGKVMSIPDSLIKNYFLLGTIKPVAEIKKLLAGAEPYKQKRILAREITALYHGAKAAAKAEQAFVKQFQKKQVPDDVADKGMTAGKHNLPELLVAVGLAASKSEARRLISQRGVKVDGVIVSSDELVLRKSHHPIIQVGKRKFIRLTVK
jgi:tyrosyl-tRNA synthetase